MTNKTDINDVQKLTLYICSGCEASDPAAMFLMGWSNGHPNFQLEIVTLDQRPTQIVRYGITHAPALVMNGELLGQNLFLEKLIELIENVLDKE